MCSHSAAVVCNMAARLVTSATDKGRVSSHSNRRELDTLSPVCVWPEWAWPEWAWPEWAWLGQDKMATRCFKQCMKNSPTSSGSEFSVDDVSNVTTHLLVLSMPSTACESDTPTMAREGGEWPLRGAQGGPPEQVRAGEEGEWSLAQVVRTREGWRALKSGYGAPGGGVTGDDGAGILQTRQRKEMRSCLEAALNSLSRTSLEWPLQVDTTQKHSLLITSQIRTTFLHHNLMYVLHGNNPGVFFASINMKLVGQYLWLYCVDNSIV